MSEQLIKALKIFWLLLAFTPAVAFSNDADKVVAKGDGIVITQGEADLLKTRMQSYFKTSDTEYCRALIKMKLFSMEARENKMHLKKEVAAELNQMMEQKLSAVYVDKMVEKYVMIPGTIESYYYSHADEFLDKNGNVMPLNDKLRAKIRNKIMLRKKSELANTEMDRLLKKYNVDIVDSGCIRKD